MPTPSKFTKDRITTILKIAQVGGSRRTQAHAAGIDEKTLSDLRSRPEQKYRDFRTQLLEAEAHPVARMLGIVYKAAEDKPELAWKFLERREHGFEPPISAPQPLPTGPVVIQLSLSDGAPLSLTDTTIEVEAVEPDETAESRVAAFPAPVASA